MAEPDLRTAPAPKTTISIYSADHAVLLGMQVRVNPDRWVYSMADLVHDLVERLAHLEAGDTP